MSRFSESCQIQGRLWRPHHYLWCGVLTTLPAIITMGIYQIWRFFFFFFQKKDDYQTFLTFPEYFLMPIIFSNLNSNCSNLSDMRNLQEQVKKAFCYQKLFWPFTAWIHCSSDLKFFANSRPAASNFKSFSQSLVQFFLTVGKNNFGTISC